MNVVMISPHFPPNFVAFSQRLRARGVNVLGIGDAPWESLPPELRQVLGGYYHVPDMERYDAMLRACAWLIHEHGRIDRLDSHNEHWLALEARLREDFNVPGQRPADTAFNRSKWGMKERCRAAGIPCAEGEPVTSAGQALAFADRVGFPIILKPDTGVGAQATHRVDDRATLERRLGDLPPGYLCETWLEGELVSFDGLADREGRPVFCISETFSDGIMQIVRDEAPMHYHTLRDLDPALGALGERTVAAFGIRERFLHAEFFRSAAGAYRLLGVNVRPPGLYSLDLMNWSCDVDLYDTWAALIAGQYPVLEYQRRYHTAHVGRRRRLRYDLDDRAVRARLGDRLLLERDVPPAFAPAMGDHCFLFRDPDRGRLEADIAALHAPHRAG
jgi:hypothetical protein